MRRGPLPELRSSGEGVQGFSEAGAGVTSAVVLQQKVSLCHTSTSPSGKSGIPEMALTCGGCDSRASKYATGLKKEKWFSSFHVDLAGVILHAAQGQGVPAAADPLLCPSGHRWLRDWLFLRRVLSPRLGELALPCAGLSPGFCPARTPSQCLAGSLPAALSSDGRTSPHVWLRN